MLPVSKNFFLYLRIIVHREQFCGLEFIHCIIFLNNKIQCFWLIYQKKCSKLPKNVSFVSSIVFWTILRYQIFLIFPYSYPETSSGQNRRQSIQKYIFSQITKKYRQKRLPICLKIFIVNISLFSGTYFDCILFVLVCYIIITYWISITDEEPKNSKYIYIAIKTLLSYYCLLLSVTKVGNRLCPSQNVQYIFYIFNIMFNKPFMSAVTSTLSKHVKISNLLKSPQEGFSS